MPRGKFSDTLYHSRTLKKKREVATAQLSIQLGKSENKNGEEVGATSGLD